MKKNMHLDNQKLDVVISQRLKLATQDMEFVEWDEVLNHVIIQDRDMTRNELELEKARIGVLYEGARDRGAHEGQPPGVFPASDHEDGPDQGGADRVDRRCRPARCELRGL